MIKNLQYRLHQVKGKQSKGAKICASIKWDPDGKNCLKTFCKTIERKNIQNQTIS